MATVDTVAYSIVIIAAAGIIGKSIEIAGETIAEAIEHRATWKDENEGHKP